MIQVGRDSLNETGHKLKTMYFFDAMHASKKALLVIASLLISTPAQAETVYLVYKHFTIITSGNASMSVVTVPMPPMDACEEEGAKLINSDRFKLVKRGERQRFECVRGR